MGVELALNAGISVGESPLWMPEEKALYFTAPNWAPFT